MKLISALTIVVKHFHHRVTVQTIIQANENTFTISNKDNREMCGIYWDLTKLMWSQFRSGQYLHVQS